MILEEPGVKDGKTKILVVEDQPEMQSVLRALLLRKGYEVHLASDAETGLRILREVHPHLVLLDVQLPDMDGLSFCKLVRVEHDLPILMVSGRGGVSDRVRGLKNGADDYLPKPFHESELMARIDALLRRSGRKSRGEDPPEVPLAEIPQAPEMDRELFRRGPLEIDLRSHEIRLNGQVLSLTRLEFNLLQVFARDAGRVFTRERLLDLAWGEESAASERLVDTHIKHLRRKLASAEPGYDPIVSVRGIGYRLQL